MKPNETRGLIKQVQSRRGGIPKQTSRFCECTAVIREFVYNNAKTDSRSMQCVRGASNTNKLKISRQDKT